MCDDLLIKEQNWRTHNIVCIYLNVSIHIKLVLFRSLFKKFTCYIYCISHRCDQFYSIQSYDTKLDLVNNNVLK